MLYNLDMTSRPLALPVTFSLKYRLYDMMDFSDTPTFSAFIINDQNGISSGPVRAGRYDFCARTPTWAPAIRSRRPRR